MESAQDSCFELEAPQDGAQQNPENQSPAQTNLLNDPVTDLLADALRRAALAGAWDTVAELTRELQARRQSASNVVSLDSVRAGKGRGQ